LLAILFVFIAVPLPFKPVQMSLISALTIGIPSFFLAFEPNHEKIQGNIFNNILKISLPSALIIVFNVIICVLLFVVFNIPKEIYSSLAVIFTGIGSFWTLYKVSLPFNLMRKILFYGLIGLFIAEIIFLNNFFSIYLFGI
jgi:cation-transporting ATPase E